VRVSLTLTLIVSALLHAGVVGGVAIGYFLHGLTFAKPAISSSQPTLVLVRHMAPPVIPVPAPAAPVVAKVDPTPAALPVQPITDKAKATHASTHAVAEINPNANVPVLPPEAVLSPTPPPVLDNHAGTVFILDVSGSMYEPYAGSTRLAYAREALSSQIRALKDGTPFAVTLYAMNARASGPLVAASDATREAAVRFLMRDVDCGGGTNLPAGLAVAQQLHAGSFVVATDGDLNMTTHELDTQAHAILGNAGQCPGLTIIGIGPRANTSAEHILQSLADQQSGTYRAEQFDGETPLITSAADADKQSQATQ
jgi:hypothetical protein